MVVVLLVLARQYFGIQTHKYIIDYGPAALPPPWEISGPIFVKSPTWGVIKSKFPLLGVIKGVYDVISVLFRLNFKVLFIAAFWAFFAGFGD